MNLLAEVTPDVPNWVQIVAQLGIGGVILWYFGNKLVPALLAGSQAQLQAFATEMKAEREAHADSLKVRDDREERRESRLHERLDSINRDITILVTRPNSKSNAA